MGRVTGLGGVFFKAQDPERLYGWYEQHLGLRRENGVVFFRWREKESDQQGTTVWSLFPQATKYFEPSAAPFMLNYRVDRLDELLAALRAAGVSVDERREDSEYGRFAWITDPEGNRVELWEPPEGS
jgi:catechol 2,3-dioxygenase-like lactoylglutathione lyase family enzyme